MTGKFKYIGTGQPPVSHNGKLLVNGDEAELGKNQFKELRGQFEPLDDNAKAMMTDTVESFDEQMPPGMAKHEQVGHLEESKKRHEEAIKNIDAAIAKLKESKPEAPLKPTGPPKQENKPSAKVE